MYAKYYSPTGYLAVIEITVLFKVRVIFKQFWIKKSTSYITLMDIHMM